jgi:formiminotetrahydrofolate cyclodeaminase
MKAYKSHTLKEYLDVLASKSPVPGGGSAAALTAATGVALISMVARYSKGRNKSKIIDAKIQKLLNQSEKIRKRLLKLVDLDAAAYLGVVKNRKSSEQIRKKALKRACDVPLEVGRLCYQAVELTPSLVKDGNRYLVSDVEVAVELLLAAFNSALINIHINNS